MCESGACAADRAYAVVRGGRLLRLSFSRSLCEHISSKVPGSEVRRCLLRVGAVVPPGGESPSGLYAVCKTSGWPLRVTLFRELADLWRHETRTVRECRVRFPED